MNQPLLSSTSRDLHVGRRFLAPFLAVLLVISAITAGCGHGRRELAPVTGKITYQGIPLQFGVVAFQPEQGQAAIGVIQPDGSFKMIVRGEGDGAAVGANRVRIACYEGQKPQTKGDGERSLGQSLIPRKYLSYDTSGIVVNVRSGSNDLVVINLVD